MWLFLTGNMRSEMFGLLRVGRNCQLNFIPAHWHRGLCNCE